MSNAGLLAGTRTDSYCVAGSLLEKSALTDGVLKRAGSTTTKTRVGKYCTNGRRAGKQAHIRIRAKMVSGGRTGRNNCLFRRFQTEA